MDPRLVAVDRRLAGVARILAVTGGKGGIGKSLVSCGLAVVLAEAGHRVGLLDLDLTGPTDHVILGLDDRFPTEQFGLEPPRFSGIDFMSVSYFVGDTPAPLRGIDVTNAILEILAVTRWGDLDVLVIDMPPGLGDATLDAVRLIRRAEYLVVCTPAQVVQETVRRTLRFLTELGAPVIGMVENMARADSVAVKDLAVTFDLPVLASIPFDDTLEAAIGDAAKLTRAPAFDALRRLRDAL